MPVHLHRQIERLRRDLLSLCALVVDQVHLAVQSLLNRDLDLAERVEQQDLEIDRREIEIEEECLRTLALYQPVAGDLRLIVCALKVNNDLERVGDIAVNIAHKAMGLASLPPIATPFNLAAMSEEAEAMLQDSLDAMVTENVKLAASVCARDIEVNRMKHENRVKAEELLRKDPTRVAALLKLLAVSRNLERMASRATQDDQRRDLLTLLRQIGSEATEARRALQAMWKQGPPALEGTASSSAAGQPTSTAADLSAERLVALESTLARIEKGLRASQATSPEKRLYTVSEVAELTKLSEWTIRNACNKGRIKAEKGPNEKWRIPREELVKIQNEGLPK
jgi:phosphate transport system protein